MSTQKMKKRYFDVTACLLFIFAVLLASCAPNGTSTPSSAGNSYTEKSELSKNESAPSYEIVSSSSSETESGTPSESSDEESSDDASTEPSTPSEESDVATSQDTSGNPGEQESSEDSSEPPAHVHEWEEADCETPKTCMTCGETTGTAAGHAWQNATCTVAKTCRVCGSTEGEANGHDWQAATCTTAKTCKACQQTTGNAADHQYLHGVCEACGEKDPNYQEPITYSQGLAYQVNKDGKTCSVSIGTCTDTEINIPPTIDGYIVTEIGEDAFANFANITSVTIPESVTTIIQYAFLGCTNLSHIEIPDSVTKIGYAALDPESCPNLPVVQYKQGLYLGNADNPYHALVGLTSTDVVSFEFHEDTKCVADIMFAYCMDLLRIELPDGITRIGNRMFEECESLESVRVPDSVTQIASMAFIGCYNLKSITFEGTMAQWNTITFGFEWNDYITEVVCSDGIVRLT